MSRNKTVSVDIPRSSYLQLHEIGEVVDLPKPLVVLDYLILHKWLETCCPESPMYESWRDESHGQDE